MVRMSDLARGKGAAPNPPPAARTEDAAPRRPGPVAPDRSGRSEPAAAAEPPAAGAAQAAALFGELQRRLEDVRELVRAGTAPSWSALAGLVERVVDALAADGELFWLANSPALPSGRDPLAVHQARVCVLAVRVGAALGQARPDLVELGAAGCLMDIGLWRLPDGLMGRVGELTPQEQTRYEAHPQAAAELIRSWTPPWPRLAEIVRQHHEREQGQGFPRGLTGEAILLQAKILGLVDSYATLTGVAGLRPHEAVREILRARHQAFPAPLVKALLNEISVFPPGTLVRLNSGEVGRVVAVNRHQPLRPRVEIHDSRSGNARVVDLSEAPFLYITSPVTDGSR